jgi:hypothetical protein|eukprot:CAMPEP_0174301732 /NCGR_PEP_ID=MMETSP0809-20121228/59211_1 /TAXON_ID=73025 ORGANISM="Eutreptiella gymnastica-like, Strain CCMP1594" /NCGR_SAMPLE_ID=MMETSP0809 /ASSEMBLY_ACC=CAM_ASM_000658 /LENGTH=297 /DNA_ID=CAMNT_0015407525 /DNA_START=17 /DNA_END=910 /DNA_ORIENTATION=-
MAASDRGNAYSAPDPCSESLEKMTKRLTSDLRARVRRLANYPPLSPEWIEMADTLQHLASVAMMEEKDSAKKEGGSIWERDELCVRYIIEEGKINMLMRTMNDFKKYQYQAMKEGAKEEDGKVSTKVFEQSLGILLKCAFTAVEALQTLDVTNMIEHIAMVLKHALESYEFTPGDISCQEFLVVRYLELIFKKLESLNNEETIMKQIECNEVVPLVLKHFEKFSPKLEKESQDPYVYFLAILMETEIYQTHKGKYIADAGDKSRLALLEGRTKEILSVDQDNRKAVRALSDNITRFK